MSRTAVAGIAIAGLAVAGVSGDEDGGGGGVVGNAQFWLGPAKKRKRHQPEVVIPQPQKVAKAKPYELVEPPEDIEYEALAYAEAYRAFLLSEVRRRQRQEDEALALLLLSQ